MSEFDRIMDVMMTEDERSLLAALLARLAFADGNLDPFELSFVGTFLADQYQGDLRKALESQPEPSEEEIGRRGRRNAEAIYVMCATLVCVDERVLKSERELLDRFGKALGLPEERRKVLDGIARGQILDQAACAIAKLQGFGEERVRAVEALGAQLEATEAEIAAACKRHDLH